MKNCPKCGTQNENSAVFCAGCGENLANVPETASYTPGSAADFFSKAKKAAQTGAEKAKQAAQAGAEKAKQAAAETKAKVQERRQEAETKKAQNVASGGWDDAVETTSAPTPTSRKPQKAGSVFADQSETPVATIGNNYLQNYLSGGGVGKGIGILTQKRFYYKGKNFSGVGKDIKSTTEEGVVSIDDITFTRFTHTRSTGLLLSTILMVILGIAAFPIFGFDDFALNVACVFWVAALVFLVTFFVKRHTLFLISFPGGGFAFNVKYYPIADIRDFQRQLHLLKDHIKEGATV